MHTHPGPLDTIDMRTLSSQPGRSAVETIPTCPCPLATINTPTPTGTSSLAPSMMNSIPMNRSPLAITNTPAPMQPSQPVTTIIGLISPNPLATLGGPDVTEGTGVDVL